MKLKEVEIIYICEKSVKIGFKVKGSDIKSSWRNRDIEIILTKNGVSHLFTDATAKEWEEVQGFFSNQFMTLDKKIRKINKELQERENEIVELLKKEKHIRIRLLVNGFLK